MTVGDDMCRRRGPAFRRAHRRADLRLDGAQLINPGASALNAGRMTVDGSMFWQKGFRAEGEVRLIRRAHQRATLGWMARS